MIGFVRSKRLRTGVQRKVTDKSAKTKQRMEELDFLGDIGNIDLPDIDINLLDFVPTDGTEETRYTVP